MTLAPRPDAWICTYALSLNSPQLVKSNIARRFRGEIARRKGRGRMGSVTVRRGRAVW